MKKILIVTSCTGEKKVNPPTKLLIDDFKIMDIFKNKQNELNEYRTKASEMYTGMQHLRVMEGVRMLRNHFKEKVLDLAIVSAGYGILHEEDIILPYEVTFNDMGNKEICEWSTYLQINEKLSKLIENYDLIIFLLGDKYLNSLRLPLKNIPEDKKLVFLASKTSKNKIPSQNQYHFLEVGQEDAKSFKYGLIGLKGYLFKLLSQDIITSGLQLLDDIYDDPNLIMKLLSKYRRNETVYQQIAISAEFEKNIIVDAKDDTKQQSLVKDIIIPKELYAKNYGEFGMKYFIPECDDRVDPNYDFIKECSDEQRVPYQSDVYAHQIYNPPNYDGILVSKVSVEVSKNKRKIMEGNGVHSYIRYPRSSPVMGDCGAFSYIDKDEPPFDTEEILEYYESLGFDIGVSIDHLIVGKITNDEVERVRRYNITQRNAQDFINKHREGKFTFIPSGVAQGWDPVSYRNSVAELINMGYKHISIGGLALSKTEIVIDVLKAVSPVIEKDTQMHLFGVQRLEAIDIFRKLGITSFDSSSYLRKAWTDSKSNYFTLDGNKYAAIRIPQSHGQIVKKLIEQGVAPLEKFQSQEEDCLSYMRLYDKGEKSLEDTLEMLLRYTELMGKERSKYEELYKRTLIDKPWKNCNCNICKEAGVETIIFRGNNRNRRRGFHNIYVFYKLFKEIIDKDK